MEFARYGLWASMPPTRRTRRTFLFDNLLQFLLVLQEHMKNCAYEDVHCTNPECNEVMPRRALQYHLVSKCRWRVVSCHFCAEMYTYKDSKVTSKQLRTENLA